MSLSVTVVICCFSDERHDAVCDALRSVERLDPPADEVIVVVDHNPELLARLAGRGPGVRLIANTAELGLSGARNSGIAAARGDLLIFLDDDAEADPEMLGQLRQRVAATGGLGSVARIEPAWQGRRPRWFPEEFLWVVGCTYRGLKPGPVRNLIGAAMCIRRSLFARVGGFQTGIGRTQAGLPLGCEETELCIRARRAEPGALFIYEPAALCRHKVPARRATWRYLIERCYAEGLSKAQIAAISGSSGSLSTERDYVLWTLPTGVLRGLAEGLVRLDPGGPARAAAIVVGLAATVAGFLRGKRRLRLARDGALNPAALSASVAAERLR